MSRLSKDSLAYTIVFAIGYFVGCSSGTTSHSTTITTGNPSATTARMLSSTIRNTATFPTNSGIQPVVASIFGSGPGVHADATIANPSGLAQSFEVICTIWGTNKPAGIHAALGNSGLVPMMFPQANVSIGITNECTTTVASVGADENGVPSGFPIFLSGTINNLVAYGVFVSGKAFRCLDTTDTSALQDNTFVRPYYDLANDTIILGSGTTQLSLSCSVAIPPGDDVAEFSVQWVKS
ncbi:MAG: hypothetical protein WBV69_09055 [Candidatus Sulfotelmatobacter sp.]